MARKKSNMSYDDEMDETQNEGSDGYQYPNAFPGLPSGGYPFAPFQYGDSAPYAGTSDDEADDYDDEDDKPKKKKPRKRRESDFFRVNRKLPCFLIFLCMLLCVAFIGISVLGAMPSMKENSIVSMLLEYTALYKKPDMTPNEDRLPTLDEDGNEVKYQDQSEYVGFFDILLGTIKSVFGIGGSTKDEIVADEDVKDAEATESPDGTEGEEETTEKKGGFSMDTPFYDNIKDTVKANELKAGLPITVADYFGFAIALFVLIALYYMIKAFAALFGKRVFKNFGLGSILLLLMGVVVLLGSVSVLSIYLTPAGEGAQLQFGALTDFLFGGFSTPPKFTFKMTGAEEVTNLPFVAGYGLYIMLVLPVVTLLISTCARKKLPYSIFD